MKRGFAQKSISLLLAILMAALLLPPSALDVRADISTPITDLSDAGFLGYGFNLLGNSPLENSTLSDKRILKSMENLDATVTDTRDTEYLFSYIKDFSSYIKNESASATYSAEASAKIKMVSLEAKAKYGLQSASSYAEDSKTEYAVLSILRTYEKKYMDLSSTKYIQRAWGQNEDGTYITLNDDFVDELYTVGIADKDIAAFFARYGTHIITRYVSGGEAILAYSGEDLSSAASCSSSTELNASAKVDVGSIVSISADMEQKGAQDESSSSATSDISFTGSVRGGDKTMEPSQIFEMMKGGNTAINDWANSITEDNSQIIVDDRPSNEEDTLQLMPIWELLYRPQDAQLKVAMEEYFNRNVNQQYVDFYEDYIYNPAQDPDYSSYTFITSAEQLQQVRNDLSGSYVLLCDIDLGDAPWTPIGTQEMPFDGIFDGNGNTISGLKVTDTAYAGLFGYNSGTIRNVSVSGKIDVSFADAENLAYLGGIAGYNTGKIENCRNMVSLNGSISVCEQSTAAAEDNFFTQNSVAIKNASNVTLKTVADGDDISVGLMPVHLTGMATDVTITVTGSANNNPAFIVLEDAILAGKIVHESNRKICIVSLGQWNSLSGLTGSVPVDIGQAQLYIAGNAALSLIGSNGNDGEDGDAGNPGSTGSNGLNQVRGSDGGTGGTGKVGKNGAAGTCAVNAGSISIYSTAKVDIYGGDGGDAGNGGKGGVGGQGGAGFAGVIGSAGAGNGGTGGTGGAGGIGGNGAMPINDSAIVYLYGGDLHLHNGAAGDGGDGGEGGKGGNGGNTTQWGAYCGWPGGGGSGGYGGKGGNNGLPGKYAYDTSKIIIVNPDSYVYIRLGQSANVGSGAHGGNIGSPGTAALDRPHQDNGTDRSSVYAADGTPSETVDYSQTAVLTLAAQHKLYRYYNHTDYFPQLQNLLSIGSASEQALIQKSLAYAGFENQNIWLGLEIINVISGDFSNGEILLKASDGSYLKVTKEQGVATQAYRVFIDSSYNITEVIAPAYINFGASEPDNQNNSECYIYLTPDATWADVDDAASFLYITEENLASPPATSADCNALFAGGICGYNDGTIRASYNVASVCVEKAYSKHSNISAYAGGISGYNNDSVAGCVNTGAIHALAVSDSMSHFARAFAYNICSGNAATNSGGYVTPSAHACSANALSIPYSDSATDPTAAKADLDQYWMNTNLRISQLSKSHYIQREEFDSSSLCVSLNGEPTEKYTVWYYFLSPGCRIVKISYTDKDISYQRSFPVLVLEPSVTGISVSRESNHRTQFYIGDSFSSDGLILALQYDNGDNTNAIPSEHQIEAPRLDTAGDKTIRVAYKGMSTSYRINVSPVVYTSLAVTKLPTKLTYQEGASLDLTGMVVTAHYNNGDTQPVTDYQISGYDSTPGVKTITVSYNGKSASFQVTVKQKEPPKITTQPVNRNLPVGKTAQFTVKATGQGLKYQWQYRTSSSGSWKNASATGNKTATLKVPVTAGRNGYQYRCKITDSNGETVFSKVVTLKAVTLKINTQPVNRYLTAGKTATFSVKAVGTGLTYRWQYRTSSSGSWKNASATGNKTATLKVPVTTGRNGYQYRCKITDQYGNVIYSNAVTLKTVTLKITTQPVNRALAVGKTAIFTVKAAGTGLTYQWQYRTSSSGSWKNASATGNKTATLKVPVTAGRNGYQYRCKITDQYGNIIYSTIAKLTAK